MSSKQNSFGAKKDGSVTHTEKNSASQQVNSLLKNLKEKSGAVIRISINKRTTIEVPAGLTQDEQDARVAKYLSLHNI